MLNNYSKNPSHSFLKEIKCSFIDFYYDVFDSVNDFFSDFKNNVLKIFNKMKKNNYWQVAFWSFIIAFLSYAYVLFTESFTLPISGDFNLQGMTFIYNGYDDWHYFFRTGIFPEWDTSGLIGVSNIDAYSFYYLFDPFFLLLLIFPRSFLLQAQALIMILKLVLAAVFCYGYLTSFKMSKTTRKFCSLAYAFCGWGWFYLWFFHFQEVITFLPLMLWGIEKIFSKKDARLFIVSCFLMGCTNYQFFAIFLICSFVYAICKYIKEFFKRGWKNNLLVISLGFVAFVLGIGLVSFIILPNYVFIQQMPRISNTTYLSNLLDAETFMDKLRLIFYWGDNDSYKHLYPLAGLLYMNTGSFSTTLFNGSGYDNAGINLFFYTPLILMIFPSLFDAIKKKQYSHVIFFVIGVISVEAPFFYYLSGLFANAYARYQLFPILMMILLVSLHFDSIKKMPRWYLDVSFALIAVLFICTTYYSLRMNKKINPSYYNLKPAGNLFLPLIIFQSIWYFLVYLFLRFRNNAKTFKKEILYLVCFEAVVMGNISMQAQTYISYSNSLYGGHQNTKEQTKIVSELNKVDSDLFRIFNTQAGRSQPNLAMVEGYNGLALFSSTYNYDSTDLFNWSRISYSGGWTFGIHEKRANLDTLLGVKYYLVRKDDNNIPFNYVKVSEDSEFNDSKYDKLKQAIKNSNFELYKNKNFINLGFGYDSYLTSDMMTNSSDSNFNEYNYLKSLIVDETYYNENKDQFNDFNKANKLNMPTTYSYKTAVYYSNWDTTSQGGKIRTLSPNYSDNDVNIWIKEYVNSNGGINNFPSDMENTSGGFLPKTKIIDYANYLLKKKNNQTPTSEELASKEEYDGEIDSTIYGRKSYIGTYPADTYTPSSTTNYNTNLSYNSKFVIFIDKNYLTPFAFTNSADENNKLYVSLQSKFGYNIDFAFYGRNPNYLTSENDKYPNYLDKETNPWPTYGFKLITHDQHMQNNYDKSGDWKYSRGFYVDEPVYLIVGTLKETLGNKNNSSQNTNVSIRVDSIDYQTESAFNSDIEKLKENSLQNVNIVNVNKYTFSSNYNEKKLVLLNVAYDKGWSLSKIENDKEVPIEYFKGQGGLISFIAEKGNVNYQLTYSTPKLDTGIKLTSISLTGLYLVHGIYYALTIDSKKFKKVVKSLYLKDGL